MKYGWLFAGRRKLRGDGGEGRLQLRAERIDHGDDRDRNSGGDEAVFDGGGARFIVRKAVHKGVHVLLLFHGGCLNSVTPDDRLFARPIRGWHEPIAWALRRR